MSDLPKEPSSRGLHHRTLTSKTFERLREGPVSAAELDKPTGSLNGIRTIIRMLEPASSVQNASGAQTADNVLYLCGDERRAMRLFIDLNEDYLVTQFSHTSNSPLAQEWPEGLFEMLCEEWGYHRLRGAADE